MAVVTVRGQSGGSKGIERINGTLPGSLSLVNGSLGGEGDIAFAQLWITGYSVMIYTPDGGTTWKNFSTGADIVWPLDITNGGAWGTSTHYARIQSIVGNTITYYSYYVRNSDGREFGETLYYALIRVK
jgi:hypothetical protein